MDNFLPQKIYTSIKLFVKKTVVLLIIVFLTSLLLFDKLAGILEKNVFTSTSIKNNFLLKRSNFLFVVIIRLSSLNKDFVINFWTSISKVLLILNLSLSFI